MDEFEIEVTCPTKSCGKQKTIKFPKYLFENKKTGIIRIQIHSEVCCEHEFIVFIAKLKDNKPTIRGYEKIDIAINFQETSQTYKKNEINLHELLNIFGDYAISSILHAFLLNIPIVCLEKKNAEKKFFQNIKNYFSSLFPENNDYQFSTFTSLVETEYKKAKILNALIITPNGVVANTPWPTIKMRPINKIISDALVFLENKMQILFISGAIKSLLQKAEIIVNLIKNQSLFEEEILNYLDKEGYPSISEDEMKLLKQIVEYRYKKDSSKIKIRSFSKLQEGLW